MPFRDVNSLFFDHTNLQGATMLKEGQLGSKQDNLGALEKFNPHFFDHTNRQMEKIEIFDSIGNQKLYFEQEALWIKVQREFQRSLKDMAQWVNWRQEMRPGQKKPTKVPYDPKTPTLTLAKSNDPSTWGTFKVAVQSMKTHKLDGIGFVVTKDDDFVGFDLDHCIEPKTGEIEAWAMKIVETLNSYTEKSPSGRGCGFLCEGTFRQKGYIRAISRFTISAVTHSNRGSLG